MRSVDEEMCHNYYYIVKGGRLADNILLVKNAMDKSGLAVQISVVGIGSKTISVFGLGKSLYDLYVAARGPVLSSRSTDQSSSVALYDRKEKLSQYYATALAKYVDGKTSHKIWMNKLETRQLYNGDPTFHDETKPLNTVEYSQYWDNNAMTI